MSKTKSKKVKEPKLIPDITKCKNGPGCTCWELMCPPCSKEIERLTKAHKHQYEMAGLFLRRTEYLERVLDKAPHKIPCAVRTDIEGNEEPGTCTCWKSKVTI